MKFRALALLAAAVIAGGLPAAPAHAGDVQGPACADFVGASGVYRSDSTLSILVDLADASCRAVRYTLVILDEAGSTEPLQEITLSGDGTTSSVGFNTTVGDDDSQICVYVLSTAGNGPHVFDRGPDTGCELVQREEGTAGGKHFNFL
ncbi:MAG TPA: hypothetical protein VNB94_03185 [Mycobacteriales bacterium]|nr:hypothetical protein [Mycobacteriales bacterium]